MKTIQYKFVEFIPDIIEEGLLYISIEYCTAVHKCICGCGNEVITPITPSGWEIIFNGKTVSLYPSIGNWSFECKSHYWIKKNKIHHAYKWDDSKIEKSHKEDVKNKKNFFKRQNKKKR